MTREGGKSCGAPARKIERFFKLFRPHRCNSIPASNRINSALEIATDLAPAAGNWNVPRSSRL
jgi:hypothetical protein